MADYTHILANVTAPFILMRNPADTSCATRGWDTAYLEIADGKVSLQTRTHYGHEDGIPVDEWLNRVLTFDIASAAHGCVALDIERLRNALREDGALAPLIERIISGHSVEWDGQNNRGRLDVDAVAAYDDMEYLLSSSPSGYVGEISVWDVEQYFETCPSGQLLAELGLTLASPDADIAAAVPGILADAKSDDILLVGDVEGYLKKVIADLAAEDDD